MRQRNDLSGTATCAPDPSITDGRTSTSKARFGRRLLGLLTSVLLAGAVQAQSSANYALTTNTSGSLVDMSTGTTQLVAASVDDSPSSAVTSMPFDFIFMGAFYNQFSVNANGMIRLGSTQVATTGNVQIGSVATAPLISAFSFDMKTHTSGKVHYKVTGTAPNRVLVIEWFNMQIGWNSTTADGTIQALLGEDGSIRFIYGTMAYNYVPGTTTISAGFQSSNTNNTYATINIGTNAVSYSGGTTNYNIGSTTGVPIPVSSASDGNRRVYTFIAPAPSAGPTNLNFTGMSALGMTVNWTASVASNVAGYLVYYSTDNVNFTFAGSTNAATTSLAVTGLTPGTNYYWKVYAISESSLSAPLTGTNPTTFPSDIASTATGGLWSQPSTWVGGVVPALGDNVMIADGATVTIDVSPTINNLTIGEGGASVLQYITTATQTLNVMGNLSITSGATFRAVAPGSTTTVTYNLNVAGNLTNGGTINFSQTAGTGGTVVNATKVNVTFSSAANANFDLSGGTAANFAGVSLNKGTGAASTLTFSAPATYTGTGASSSAATITVASTSGLAVGMYVGVTSGTGAFAAGSTVTAVNSGTTFTVSAAPTTTLAGATIIGSMVAGASSASTGFLTITNGTFVVGGSNTYSVPVFATAAYTIPATGGLRLNNANATVTGQNGNPTLNGALTMTAGTLNIGNATGNIMGAAATANWTMTGGTVNIASRFYTTSAMTFNMSGGTINVTTTGNSTSSSAGFGINAAASSFTMSGGTINLVQASTGGTQWDYYVSASAPNITGGTLNVGTAATLTNFTFNVLGAAPSIVINNTTNNKTLRILSTSPLNVYGTLTANTGTTVNLNGTSLTVRGASYTNDGTLTGTATGSRLTFFSPTAQTFAGSGTVTSPLDGLGVQTGGGGLTISHVNGFNTLRVNLFAGTITNSNKITLGAGAANAVTVQTGYAGSVEPGGAFDAAPNFNLGTGTFTITAQQESVQRTLNFELPSTRTINSLVVNNTNGVAFTGGGLSSAALTLTAGKLTTDNTNLLTISGTTTGSVSGGSATTYVNGPLVRTLPASLATGTTYTFPIGKSGYNPFELVNALTTGGTVAIQAEVFDANAGGTPGLTLSTLSTSRYWRVQVPSGVANLTSSLVKLNDTRGSFDAIGASSTQSGTYNLVGGFPSTQSATSITSIAPAVSGSNLGAYYLMATTAPPAVTSVTMTPNATTVDCNASQPHTISADITSGATITSVVLNYKVNGGTTQTVTMTNSGGSTYTGTIPAVSPINGIVTWSIIATDANNLSSTTAGSTYQDAPLFGIVPTIVASQSTICSGNTVTLTATIPAVVMSQTFDALPASNFTATAPLTASQSSLAAQGSGSVVLAYTASMDAAYSYTSNINLSNSGAAQLMFSHIVASEAGLDYMYLQYSADGGVTWISFPTSSYTGSATLKNGVVSFDKTSYPDWSAALTSSGVAPTNALWKNETINIPVSALTNQFRLRFRITSDNSVQYAGWFVDNVRIIGNGTQPNYFWAPGGETTSVPTLEVTPAATTTYNVVAVDNNSCLSDVSPSVTITVNTTPTAPTATNSAQCGLAVPTASVASTSGLSAPTFKWYDAATAGNLLQTSTSTTYTTAISSTTTFYVSEINLTGNCEGPRTAVTVTVSTPDAVTASSNAAAPVCTNAAVALTATQTGSNQNYTYTWTGSPVAGSGILTSVTGASVTVNPTTAGTYVYTVTAVDGSCTTTSTVSVTVATPPIAPVIVATPTDICAGGTATLTPAASGFSNTFEAASFPLTNATMSAGALVTRDATYFSQGASSLLFNSNTASSSETLTLTNNINLSTATSAQVTFSHIAALEGYLSTFDIGHLDYSSDGGSTWTPFPASAYAGSGTLVGTDLGFSTKSYPDWTSSLQGATATPTNALWKNETVNIPASALTSQFRLRFRITTDGSVYYYGWLIDNLRIGAVGADPVSYTWSTGATTLVGSPSITVSPASTTSYTVVANDASGCSSAASASVSVTVNPLPSTPTATNSAQCGFAIPTASVASTSGLPTPTFKWYDAATDGNLLQTSTSSTYTTGIDQTTTFYVSELNTATGCEGARVAVTVTVANADDITASANGPICLGSAVNLSVAQTGSNQTYTYTWTAAPVAGSGIATSLSGATQSVTPTAAGTYVYTVTGVDNSCSAASTISVTVNTNPVVSTATATPGTVCPGASVSLAATSTAIGAGNIAVGAGAQSIANAYNAPFYSLWSNKRMQVLFKASELTAAGLHSGPITALNFPTTAGTLTMQQFTIKLAHTNAADVSSFLAPTFTTVYSVATQTQVANTDNRMVLSTPFTWDGTSNLVMEICFGNPGSSSTMNSTAPGDATSYVSVIKTHVSSATAGTVVCGNTASNVATFSQRPKVIFEGQRTNNITSNYTWTWNPGGLTGATATATAPANLTNAPVTQVYTATATNATTGCFGTATASVTVNPTVPAPTASNSTQCGLAVPTASVASNSGLATPTFKWYDAASAGTLLQNSTSATYTTAISTTTTFYVSEFNPTTGCEGARTAVTVTVTQPDAVSASANGPVCLGSMVNLSASQTGSTNNYVFTWTATPASGSGIPTSTTGASVGVTPTTAGTYTYLVTAFDATLGCTTTATASVAVNPNPIVTNVTASPSSVCPGSTVALSASSSDIGAGTVTIGAGATSASSVYNAPFYSNWSNKRMQILFKASELTAANLRAGNITALNFPTTAGTTAIQNVTIKMANSTQADMSSFVSPTFTTVFTAATLAQTANTNNRVALTTPFNWDGTSDIVMEICFYNPSSTATIASTSPADATTYVSVIKNHTTSSATASTVCGLTTSNSATYSERPKVIFEGQAITDFTGNYTWTFNPGNLSGSSVVATVPSTPGVYTYTARATNATTGCFAEGTVNVTVGAALNVTTSSTPTAICAGNSASIAANVTGGGAPYTYSWKDAGNNVIGTTQSLSVSPATTSVYTVTVTDFCGTIATQTVTVNVNSLPTVSITPNTTTSVCASSQNLTSTTTAASPSYQWLLGGSNINLATSSSYSATASGDYSLKVTDGVTGCSQTSAVTSVTLLAYPASIAVTPSSATTICLGQSQTLTATATLQNNSSPNVTILAENFDAGTLGNFSVVNATITNTISQWAVRNTPYTYGTALTNVTIDGTKFALTNSDEPGSGSTTQSRLVSNSFSTVGFANVVLNFKHFARAGGTIITEYTTDGTNWSTIPSGDFTGGTTGGASNPPTIISSSLTLPAAALNKPSVRVRFRYDAGWNWYWAVDDIRVMGTSQGYYAWSANATAGVPNAAATAAANNNSISVTPTAAGSYTYTVTASVPGNSCTNSATVTLNVLTPSTAPTMLNSSASGAVCANSNVILTQTGGS
ncbi:MAG: hypothetical protein EOO08_09240, partial [Chitinophagaceae bacterium]